ncbi:MAG: 30S ribosome-binding factor RbfA [Ruminococcaceae bacterium]|nr:30S ribosome-binding factor RbfA [Oscillospiraceae bacterium]
MAKHRRGRINEEMFKETAKIMQNVKDPRISENFVSVTAVDVTPDLKFAKVYYSALRGDPKEIKKGLASCSGFIRGQIAKNLNLRITPELTFVEDTSIAYGAKIEKIISGFTYVTEEFSDEDKADGDEWEDDEDEDDDE